jgi:SPP1 family predicted phage head-tail adaptor
MNIGDLDRRVTLQQHATGQDAYGEIATGWVDVATVWAAIWDMSGREYIAAAATQAAVQTKITIRYRPGVVAAMRAVYGTDVYNIDAVLVQGKVSMTLMCTRGVNNG